MYGSDNYYLPPEENKWSFPEDRIVPVTRGGPENNFLQPNLQSYTSPYRVHHTHSLSGAPPGNYFPGEQNIYPEAHVFQSPLPQALRTPPPPPAPPAPAPPAGLLQQGQPFRYREYERTPVKSSAQGISSHVYAGTSEKGYFSNSPVTFARLPNFEAQLYFQPDDAALKFLPEKNLNLTHESIVVNGETYKRYLLKPRDVGNLQQQSSGAPKTQPEEEEALKGNSRESEFVAQARKLMQKIGIEALKLDLIKQNFYNDSEFNIPFIFHYFDVDMDGQISFSDFENNQLIRKQLAHVPTEKLGQYFTRLCNPRKKTLEYEEFSKIFQSAFSEIPPSANEENYFMAEISAETEEKIAEIIDQAIMVSVDMFGDLRTIASENVNELYQAIDVENSGFISRKELRSFMSSTGLTEDELSALFIILESGSEQRTGLISSREFLK